MMDKLQCILCYSIDIIKTESINTNDLVKLYRKRAGVDVQRFFTQKNIDFYTCNNCGLKFYWPQAIGDGAFYDKIQQYDNYYLKDKAEYIEAAKQIKNTDEVLEIGCGEGLFTNFINSRSYTGLEFSDHAIAKARNKGLTVLKESIEAIANANSEKYNVICCFQVLEHVNDPGKFISDCVKCLKQDGKLIIAVPSEDSFINKAVNFYLNMPPHHASRWTDYTLKKVSLLFGLRNTDIFHEPLNNAHLQFYLKTNIFRNLFNLSGKNLKSIRLGIFHKFFYGISAMAAIILSAFYKSKKYIKGQSVLVIYTK